LHRHISLDPHHQISVDERSTEVRQEGGSARDLSGKTMAPIDVKFPRGTQFTFRSLTFVMRKDGDQKMLRLEAAQERFVLVHGPDSCSPANSSILDGAHSRSNPYAGLFLHTVDWSIEFVTEPPREGVRRQVQLE
jgi:hypothetical protein